jgi:hypothetical protein
MGLPNQEDYPPFEKPPGSVECSEVRYDLGKHTGFWFELRRPVEFFSTLIISHQTRIFVRERAHVRDTLMHMRARRGGCGDGVFIFAER